MTDRDVMAQDAADEGQVVFRLNGPAKLYERPSDSSPVVETLPEGSLVTVQHDAGPFLRVATAAGCLGYLPDTALVTLVQGSPSGGALGPEEEERSRRRDALIFLSRMEDEAERAKQQPGASPSMAGVVSAALGLAGLLTTHAIRGMSNEELMVFSGLDVLLPLVVLTANPKAPLVVYMLVVMAYLALVTGYVAI